MKPKHTDAKPFTMDDFEKGLVLAGLLTPRTIQELEEIESLKNYETQEESTPPTDEGDGTEQIKNIYFKRVVLAAEIVSELHDEPTFGRVKFQKLVFLCEHVAHMNLEKRYLKLAAGPFDNKFMHTIETDFRRLNWFAVEKITSANITRSKYVPLEKWEGYKKYYSAYFRDTQNEIKSIIDLFRQKNTAFAEISATLFACFLELKDTGGKMDEDQLLSRFYAWSENKQQYDRNLVLANWVWLQAQGLVTI